MSVQDFSVIAPVVVRFAERRLQCPDRQAVALVLAWWYWESAPEKRHLPASVWARNGVRSALAGRDLPGIRSKFRDAFDRLCAFQGAGMGEMRERRPGPVETAIAKEDFEAFDAGLDPFERDICELFSQGLSNSEVAQRLGRSQGRISQKRREMMERHQSQ